MSKREIDFILTVDNAKFTRALSRSATKVDKMASSIAKKMKPATAAFTSFSKGVALAGAAGAAAVAAAGIYKLNSVVRESIELANVQEAAETKLAAVLNATGGAAGYSLEQLKGMAGEMQGLTTVGDEVIINSMAVLATFKNIKGANFKEATQAALDMSAVLDQDLKTSTLQLGKALNDPVKGMSALTRSGVSFTEAQKEQVKAMQAAGNIYGAQKIILKEMSAQFGGTAAALRGTFKGALEAAGNALGDVKEEIGFAITKNTFFIESLNLMEQKYISLGGYIKANREEVMEWAKQGALSGLDFAEGLVSGADIVYRSFSGIQGLFQATAGSALYISGGIFNIIEAAAKLSDQLHLTENAAAEWGVNSEAAFAAADDIFAQAAGNFEQMQNGSSKLQFVQQKIAGLRTELQQIEATEVDPAAKLATNTAKSITATKQELKKIDGTWVQVNKLQTALATLNETPVDPTAGLAENAEEDVANAETQWRLINGIWTDISKKNDATTKKSADAFTSNWDTAMGEFEQSFNVSADKIEARLKKLAGPHQVTVQVTEARQGGGVIGSAMQHLATGGTVWKNVLGGARLPGFGGGDRVPVMAEAGEVMINKMASKAAGYKAALAFNSQRWDVVIAELLKRFNLPGILKAKTGGIISRMPQPVLPKFAVQHLVTGGPVLSSSGAGAAGGSVINVTLHYSGSGTRQDASRMNDMVMQEIQRRDRGRTS